MFVKSTLQWFLVLLTTGCLVLFVDKSPLSAGMKNTASSNLRYVANTFNGMVIRDPPITHRTLLDGRYKIQPRSCNGAGGNVPHTVLFVPSRPKNAADRAAVRETWGVYARLCNIRVIFGMGDGLLENETIAVSLENSIHDDILQSGQIVDAYHNQTDLVLSFFAWAIDHCQGVPFVGKADEDSWINAHGLRKYISQNPARNSIYGHFFYDVSPNRAPGDKYRLTRKQYPKDVYPPYASGNLYVFHFADLPRVLKASGKLLKHWIDDVFIAGQIPEFLRMKIVHIAEWSNGLPEVDCPGRDFVIIHSVEATVKRSLFYSNCTRSLRSESCSESFVEHQSQKS